MSTPEKRAEVVAAHIFATLPDSITQRKALLESLLHLVPAGSTAMENTRQLLFHLHVHEAKQHELNFKPSPTPDDKAGN